MAVINKITKYHLEERVLALAGDGKTTGEIAQILTDNDLVGRDSISQPSVSRWLKEVRKDRSEQTRQVVHDHIKATVPRDMEALDEVELWLLDEFRRSEQDLRLRADLAMKVVKIIETKLKFAGILEEPGELGYRSADLLDLESFRADLQSDGNGQPAAAPSLAPQSPSATDLDSSRIETGIPGSTASDAEGSSVLTVLPNDERPPLVPSYPDWREGLGDD